MSTHFLYSEQQAIQYAALCNEMGAFLKTILLMKEANSPKITDDLAAGMQRLLDRQEKLALAQ